MLNSAKHSAAIRAITPETAHTIRVSPTEPAYRNAELGETNMPDPIIELIMKLDAPRSPSSLFNSILFSDLAVTFWQSNK